MKNAKKLAVLGLALALLACSAIGASAATYVANVVDEDFASASDCSFSAPGDMNADGALNATDATSLRKLMLGNSNSHGDINGDFAIDVRDLVRQKKVIAAQEQHIVDGALALNGSSVYSGDFLAKIGTGASYVINFDYMSEAPIKVVISGLGDDIVLEAAASTTLTSATFTQKMPLTKIASGDAELRIVGVGTVDNFSVTRINMDNELIESWD